MQGSGDLIGCGGGRGGNEQHLFLAGAFLGSTTTEIVYLGTFSQPARNQGRQSTFRERVSIQGAPAQSHPNNLCSAICTISSPRSAQSYPNNLFSTICTISSLQSAQSHPNNLRNLHSLTLGGYEQAGAEKPTEGKRGGRTEAMFAKDILSLCSA